MPFTIVDWRIGWGPGGRFGKRSQAENERASATRNTRHSDSGPVSVGDPLRQGQPQSHTRLSARCGRIGPVEPLEQVWQRVSRDTNAAVTNRQRRDAASL